jgi:hypothetical protein
MTTQAPSRPPATFESGFFSARMLRRWLTRVDTVTLPTHGPVLDVPPGLTFNSVDGQVVDIDNRGLGGDVPPPSPPIEMAAPPARLLVGLRLFSLALRRGRARPGSSVIGS